MQSEPNHKPALIYVGDPMCSWCWGFSPALRELMTRYPDELNYSLIVGGLRPGSAAAPLDDGMKAYIGHHWRQVNERSGQPFNHAFLERDDFVYDTEPGCRAVVAARRLAPERAFEYMEAVHEAFYARNLDPTRLETFLAIASAMDLPREDFKTLFESDEIKRETEGDFLKAREMGVHGFPSTLLREGNRLTRITQGWVPTEQFISSLGSWLDK